MKCSSNYYFRQGNNPAFCSRIRVIGGCSDAIKNALLSNAVLKSLSKGEDDIFVYVSSRVSTYKEVYKQGKDEVQYLCKLTKGKGFWANLKNMVKPDVVLSPDKKFHSEYSVLGFIREIGNDVKEKLIKGKKA